jgi:hypothetical protein
LRHPITFNLEREKGKPKGKEKEKEVRDEYKKEIVFPLNMVCGGVLCKTNSAAVR